MKLKKKKCVVLKKVFKDKSATIIGVFKNEKQAEKYVSWLEPNNKEAYLFVYTSFYTYENEVKEHD